MAVSSHSGHSLVHGLAKLLRNDGDLVLDGSSTLTLPATSLQHLTRLFEQYLLSRSQQHGFLALPSHPADTASLLQLQFLFDVLQKTISLKLINPPDVRLQSMVKIFPFKSLKYLELKRIPPHCLEGLRGVYSQLEVFTCSKSLSSLEELLSLCGGDLSSALPWLELHTLNFSYNSIACLDQSLSLLNVLKSLDLSHNKIQKCAEFLKPLSELKHLNLGYNCLQRAPTLGLSARTKLLTLILRNNELETINGVEQLSSLQHLDLAYNLLLEHAQLAPLSMLHCLNTLSLEGNPLYFLKTHRTCTVRHLSPKAATLKLKLDGIQLSSTEISVLPKPGLLVIPIQTSHSAVVPPERRTQEGSSGAGELSDSLSVGDVVVSKPLKKKSRSKVKVRRASISEPSDTDYDSQQCSYKQRIVLPHKEEIERMSSFREQLGEDWLRYHHHLEGGAPSVAPVMANQSPSYSQTLPNGFSSSTPRPPTTSEGNPPSTSTLEIPEVLPPPLLSSETRLDTSALEGEQDTESTLQWPTQNTHNTESTLEESTVDGPVVNQRAACSPKPSPDCQRSSQADGGETKEEDEEEELGVDLCHPLLVGILSEKEEDDFSEGEEVRRSEVFLRIKQGLVLEVDMQRGQERCRLELNSLARVETTEAAWSRLDKEETFPAVELHFNYISREKRMKRYVLLDDDPLQALQALNDVLTRAVEENQQRDSALRPGQVHLQCLRCRSEFALKQQGKDNGAAGGGEVRRRGSGMLAEHDNEQGGEELLMTEHRDDKKGSTNICPECGSDHVVQLAKQSTPYSSTPNQRSSRPDSEDDHIDVIQSNSSLMQQVGNTAILGSSPILASSNTVEKPVFISALNSFFIGDTPDDSHSLSYNSRCHSREELAGSYHYAATGMTPPTVQTEPVETTAVDDVDLLSQACEAVDHRLKLFLDVEVFEEEEEFHSFVKMSAVKFGEPGEVPSLLVVSNQRIYFLEMMSENHRGQLSDWLQKRDSHPILELSYLEVGLGSQCIHMEFGDGGVAYTLLVRDSVRCKRFFGSLTEIVREMAHKSDSKLKSISTTRLNPQHHLWPLVCEDIQADVEDGQLQFFYILAFVLQEDIWTPLTVLATRETLYLLKEDNQWTKSPRVSTDTDSTGSCSGAVTVLETLPISCVSSVHLWPSDPHRIEISLYDETLKLEKRWCVRSESEELLQGLLTWVKSQWETMFGVKLHTEEAT